MRYDVYLTNPHGPARSRIRSGVTVREAAIAVGLTEDDISWAIEGYGRCDTGREVVVPFGAPAPEGSPV